MTAGELAAWCGRLRRYPPAVTLTLPGGPYRIDSPTTVDVRDGSVVIAARGVTLYTDPDTPTEVHT